MNIPHSIQIFISIIIALCIIVSSVYMSGILQLKSTNAFTFGLPFGGRISRVTPCVCNGGFMISINNFNTSRPGPINLLFLFGFSRLFERYSPVPGRWTVGDAAPAIGRCRNPCISGCCTSGQFQGVISIIGTS